MSVFLDFRVREYRRNCGVCGGMREREDFTIFRFMFHPLRERERERERDQERAYPGASEVINKETKKRKLIST